MSNIIENIVNEISYVYDKIDLINEKFKINLSNRGVSVDSNDTIPTMINKIDDMPVTKFPVWYIDNLRNSCISCANLSTTKRESDCSVYKNKIYIFSGHSSSTNTTEVYDPVTNTYELKEPMLTGRSFYVCNAVNENFYLMGGSEYTSTATNKNECYNAITDTWTSKADVPISSARGSGVAIGNKIYFTGGNGSTSSTSSNLNPFINNECYNTVTDTWTSETDMLATRHRHCCVTYNDKLYVIGGCIGSNTTAVDYIDEYNLVTKTWTIIGAMAIKRHSFVAQVFNNSLYTTGGLSNGEVVTKYNFLTGENETLSTISEEPREGTSAIIDNKFYILGGTYTSGSSTSASKYNLCYII